MVITIKIRKGTESLEKGERDIMMQVRKCAHSSKSGILRHFFLNFITTIILLLVWVQFFLLFYAPPSTHFSYCNANETIKPKKLSWWMCDYDYYYYAYNKTTMVRRVSLLNAIVVRIVIAPSPFFQVFSWMLFRLLEFHANFFLPYYHGLSWSHASSRERKW